MDAFNRNVIIDDDIVNLQNPNVGTPRTLNFAPPGGRFSGDSTPSSTDSTAAPTNDVPVPTADGFMTKLLKYVPLEILGAYLFVEGLIISNVDDPSQLNSWLFWVLLITIVLAAMYMRFALSVVRVSQIAMGALGLAVYVFCTGGWFGTLDWYMDWYSSLALAGYGILVAIIKLPSLPVDDQA